MPGAQTIGPRAGFGQAWSAGQPLHPVLPAVLYIPWLQTAQCVALWSLYVPGEHLEEAELPPQRWPAGHPPQRGAPCRLNVPAAHGAQVVEPVPPLKVPARQMTGSSAGDAQAWPAGHGVQATELFLAEYVPVLQTTGTTAASAQAYPGGQS